MKSVNENRFIIINTLPIVYITIKFSQYLIMEKEGEILSPYYIMLTYLLFTVTFIALILKAMGMLKLLSCKKIAAAGMIAVINYAICSGIEYMENSI